MFVYIQQQAGSEFIIIFPLKQRTKWKKITSTGWKRCLGYWVLALSYVCVYTIQNGKKLPEKNGNIVWVNRFWL